MIFILYTAAIFAAILINPYVGICAMFALMPVILLLEMLAELWRVEREAE